MGTRPSRLAIKQGEEIKRLFPEVEFKDFLIQTQGDQDKLTVFTEIEGSDFFTRQLEEALLRGGIDVAVHSAKDLEENMPAGLVIAAITRTISPYECLVSRKTQDLDQLKPGALVGTSSSKRKEALLRYRQDLKVGDLRGTIEERLAQLDEGKFDALVMAHAALMRLGYASRISQIIPAQVIAPHPLQGALAIQVRADDRELIRLFSKVDTKGG